MFVHDKKVEAMRLYIVMREQGKAPRAIAKDRTFRELWDSKSNKTKPDPQSIRNLFSKNSHLLSKNWLQRFAAIHPNSKVNDPANGSIVKRKLKGPSIKKTFVPPEPEQKLVTTTVNLNDKLKDLDKADKAFQQQKAITLLVDTGFMNKEEGYDNISKILNDL